MALNDDDYASLPAKILEQARWCSLSIQLFLFDFKVWIQVSLYSAY